MRKYYKKVKDAESRTKQKYIEAKTKQCNEKHENGTRDNNKCKKKVNKAVKKSQKRLNRLHKKEDEEWEKASIMCTGS